MDEYDDYDCLQTIYIRTIKKACRPSLSRQHNINLYFSFEFKVNHWIRNQESESQELVGQNRLLSTVSTHVSFRESSYDEEEIQEEVETALTPLPLSDINRRQLIELALDKASETVEDMTSSCGCKSRMDLEFKLLVVDHHFFRSLQEIDQVCMVPASDSAVKSLKRYENLDSGNNIVESCIICFEDFSDEGCEALCMPCDHVFHGDCIKKWLETSHYCPLCRFEMPTS